METTTTIPSSDNRSKPPRRLWVAAIVVLWLGAVLAGAFAMLNYDFSSGGDPAAPEHWPVASRIRRVADRPTLMVFAHPRCPCTAATLDELAEVLAATGSGIEIKVLFFTPSNAGSEWTDAPSVSRAAAIPGVTVVSDESGREAQLFHAVTSGRTMLYDPNGRLLFDGGITGSRGHVGDNTGATALLMLLTHRSSTRTTTPVFGCSILERDTTCDSSSCQH